MTAEPSNLIGGTSDRVIGALVDNQHLDTPDEQRPGHGQPGYPEPGNGDPVARGDANVFGSGHVCERNAA